MGHRPPLSSGENDKQDTGDHDPDDQDGEAQVAALTGALAARRPRCPCHLLG
jgi:hypothetical protein